MNTNLKLIWQYETCANFQGLSPFLKDTKQQLKCEKKERKNLSGCSLLNAWKNTGMTTFFQSLHALNLDTPQLQLDSTVFSFIMVFVVATLQL